MVVKLIKDLLSKNEKNLEKIVEVEVETFHSSLFVRFSHTKLHGHELGHQAKYDSNLVQASFFLFCLFSYFSIFCFYFVFVPI